MAPVTPLYQPKIPPLALDQLSLQESRRPVDFFTPSEQKSLQSIFEKYALYDPDLGDALGFDFFCRLEWAIEECKAMQPLDARGSELEEISTQFCRSFFALQYTYIHQAIVGDGAPRVNSLGAYPQFLRVLTFVYENMDREVSTSFKLGQSRKRMKPRIDLYHKNAQEHLAHLSTVQQLFIKIIKSPQRDQYLSTRHFSYFPEHQDSQLHPTTNGVVGLENTIKFVVKLLNATELTEFSTDKANFTTLFLSHLDLLKKYKNKPFTVEFMKEWCEINHTLCSKLGRLMPRFYYIITAARQGNLTPEYLRQINLGHMAPSVVLSLVTDAFLTTLFINNWANTINRMTEIYIFMPCFPTEYEWMSDMMREFLERVSRIQAWVKEYQVPMANRALPPALAACELQFNQSMQKAYQPLISFFSETPFHRCDSLDSYSQFMFLINDLDAGIVFLDPLLEQALKAQIEFAHHLKSAIPKEGERKKWLEEIRRNYFEHIYHLFEFVQCFTDVQRLLEKHVFLADLDYPIARPLLSFSSFPGRGLFKIFAEADCNSELAENGLEDLMQELKKAVKRSDFAQGLVRVARLSKRSEDAKKTCIA